MKRRDMPADFGPHARKPINKIISIYGCGSSTAIRWRREHAGELAPTLPPNHRPMPDDFAQHAGKTTKEVMAIYGCGTRKVAAWRKQVGLTMANVAIPLPSDFLTVAPTMTWRELADHYGYSEFVIRRFVKLTGVKTKARIRDQRRTYPGASSAMGRAKPAMTSVNRDTSRAGMAADYLRKLDAVIRCDAEGRYKPDGNHWRCGSRVLSADEIIARAVRKGFAPDAWKALAA